MVIGLSALPTLGNLAATCSYARRPGRTRASSAVICPAVGAWPRSKERGLHRAAGKGWSGTWVMAGFGTVVLREEK